jgi:hypothetical protein
MKHKPRYGGYLYVHIFNREKASVLILWLSQKDSKKGRKPMKEEALAQCLDRFIPIVEHRCDHVYVHAQSPSIPAKYIEII